MNNKIISFIIGALLKIVDDNNDMDLFKDNYIIFVKIFLTILTVYWINIDYNYSMDMVITCIVCYLIKQIDTPYYKIGMLIIILNFLYKLKYYEFTFDLFIDKIITFIVLFIAAYIENNLFKEEYSQFKLYARISGFLITILYVYIFTFHKKILYDNNISKNRIIKILYPEIDAILIVLGYIFISIIDIGYMLANN